MIKKGLRVAVIYEPERSHPKVMWFDLQGEQAKVQEECYFWQSHEGKAEIFHYSLQTDKGLYEIQFNSVDQIWRMK